MSEEGGERLDAQEAQLRRTFNEPALQRLVRSEQEYYSKHGHYVPALAQLLLIEQAALQAAREETRRLRETLEDLHAEVEMGEAIGLCLENRVPALRAGALLASPAPDRPEGK